MGRKIPGRKHHGVRDPEKQRQRRLNLLKDKINLPPTNPDEQHIPKSLVRLMELKDKTSKGEFDKKPKKKKKPNDLKLQRHKFKSEKPTPIFKQLEGESEQNFMRRVNKVCDETLREAEFEEKFGVDVKHNVETGKVEAVVKRNKKDVIKKTTSNPLRLTKSQKRRKKLLERKERRALSKRDEFDDYKDDVKFGEVVQAPPSLPPPKKAQKEASAPRPGQKDLLLKSTLAASNLGDANKNKVIDRSGKRKELPNALRRQLDKQHEEVILAYKKLKAQKYVHK